MSATRKCTVLAASVIALAGGGVIAAPANATSTQAAWRHVWGPAKISNTYLNGHHQRWVSGTWVPGAQARGTFRCWNAGDGGQAKLQIVRVETGKVIADSGWKYCTWATFSLTKKAAKKGSYRRGEGVRLVLQTRKHAHTTYVAAYTR